MGRVLAGWLVAVAGLVGMGGTPRDVTRTVTVVRPGTAKLFTVATVTWHGDGTVSGWPEEDDDG